MIKSMTGYGKSTLEINSRKYQVEIKSLNHRYLDISIRMPKQLSYLEETIKQQISSKISRGKIDVFISWENNSIEGRTIKINTALAKAYIEELRKLAEEENLSDNIEVNDIARYPDVLIVQENQEDETIKNEIIEVVNKAVNNLVEMKQNEGIKIAEDLQKRLDYIQEEVNKVKEFSTGLINEYIVKLEERIKELLPNNQEIDKNRLMQEIVIYADKCSIEEEVTRLNSHIGQFKEFLKSDETVGKKLDFIIQEMNRETNTIGSKANNLDITNGVINIKTELEDIREQVQNIE